MRLRIGYTETGKASHATYGKPYGAHTGRGGWVYSLCHNRVQMAKKQGGRRVSCLGCRRELRKLQESAAQLLGKEES